MNEFQIVFLTETLMNSFSHFWGLIKNDFSYVFRESYDHI